MTEGAAITLLLCTTCAGAETRDQDRDAIRAALQRQGLDDRVRLRAIACMGACEAPVSLGLQGAGRASYVFAGLVPQQDAADIAKTCQHYLDSPEGWIEDARPCGRLRLCLRTRLPALKD